MPTPVGPQSQSNPAQTQLRDQLLTVFRDSRQLKENSAQLRQRLVSAVFGVAQQQIDTARAERFQESEASKARKGQRQAIGLQTGISAVGGAVTGGIAGGIAAGLPGATVDVGTGATLGTLAGLGGGLGQGAAAPAPAIFTEAVTKGPQRAADTELFEALRTRGTTGNVVPAPAAAVTANQPLSLEAPGVATSPAVGFDAAANRIAAIASMTTDELTAVGRIAMTESDRDLAALVLAEARRRGIFR